MKRETIQKLQHVILVLAYFGILCLLAGSGEKPVPSFPAVVESDPEQISFGKIPEQHTEKKAGEDRTEGSASVSNPVDFDAWRELNPDVYAYLYIDQTNVDYPVLQHPSDNAYYLDHNVDKTSGYPGSVFTEKENAKDFTDPNTMLYGHNMKSGAMFHTLFRFQEPEFFKKNKYVYIYTPDNILQYEVFAAYTFDDRHLLYSYDFQDETEFSSYLDEVQGISDGNIRKDITLTGTDRILTMSTCNGVDDERFLVQAVLVREIDCKYKTECNVAADESKDPVFSGMKPKE